MTTAITADKNKIIIRYKQYLKLEKSLSDNTVEAYLTDLDKLLSYLTIEGIDFREATLDNLENFSAGLNDIGIHARSQARILSGIRSIISSSWKTTSNRTPPNCLNRRRQENICRM